MLKLKDFWKFESSLGNIEKNRLPMLCRQTDRQEVRQTHTHTHVPTEYLFDHWHRNMERLFFWREGDIQLWIDKAGKYNSFNWKRWDCSWSNEMIVLFLTSVHCSNLLLQFCPCTGAVRVWKPFGSHHLFQIYPLCSTVLICSCGSLKRKTRSFRNAENKWSDCYAALSISTWIFCKFHGGAVSFLSLFSNRRQHFGLDA